MEECFRIEQKFLPILLGHFWSKNRHFIFYQLQALGFHRNFVRLSISLQCISAQVIFYYRSPPSNARDPQFIVTACPEDYIARPRMLGSYEERISTD